MTILDIESRAGQSFAGMRNDGEPEGFFAFIAALFSCFWHVDPRAITEQERRTGRTAPGF